MPTQPSVILTGFADEAANQKTATQQFAAFAALGLQYYSIRFIDIGNGVKNVMQLTKSEITKIRQSYAESLRKRRHGTELRVRARLGSSISFSIRKGLSF